MLAAMASELKPVYLLSGSDRPKIALALRRLRNRFDENAVELRSALETTADEIVAACNSMGLFAGADGDRLVIVDDVDGRPIGEGRLTGGWKAAELKAIAAYVEAPAPGTVLALVGHELKRDSALAKACAKTGELLVYDVPKKKLTEWVGDQFQRRGVTAERDACHALVELVGDNLEELAIEVEKLATWAGGETVGVAAVERHSPPRASGPAMPRHA